MYFSYTSNKISGVIRLTLLIHDLQSLFVMEDFYVAIFYKLFTVKRIELGVLLVNVRTAQLLPVNIIPGSFCSATDSPTIFSMEEVV